MPAIVNYNSSTGRWEIISGDELSDLDTLEFWSEQEATDYLNELQA